MPSMFVMDPSIYQQVTNTNFENDGIYPFCFRVSGMSEPGAKLISICDRIFQQLVLCIPVEERGDLDAENHFLNEIDVSPSVYPLNSLASIIMGIIRSL